jgi:hypothetical protein
LSKTRSAGNGALTAISMLLTGFISAGVTLSKATVMGQELAIERPQYVPLALWLTWGYFAIRYLQLLRRDLRDAGPEDAHQVFLNQMIQKRAIPLA